MNPSAIMFKVKPEIAYKGRKHRAKIISKPPEKVITVIEDRNERKPVRKGQILTINDGPPFRVTSCKEIPDSFFPRYRITAERIK